jgi:hypothetical protein
MSGISFFCHYFAQNFRVMLFRKYFLMVSAFLIAFNTSGQIGLSDIQQEGQCSKKVRKYIAGFIKHDLLNFNELQASVGDDFSVENFSTHQGGFSVDAPLEKLWETSLKANPAEIWRGSILSLAFIYNKADEKLLFLPDLNNYNLVVEQIYFINLRLLKGIFNLPTALKVTKVDPKENIIEFTYLRGGKSEGRQILHFIAESETRTRVDHTTYYRSRSRFRDKRLYPHFHQLAISELHKNMGNKALEMP